MVDERLKYAYGCIDRIHHLWFDWTDDEHALEKITGLFEALSRLAPYECVHHVHYLWLAYRHAKEERLWSLARHRLAGFSAGLKALRELAEQLPAWVKGDS